MIGAEQLEQALAALTQQQLEGPHWAEWIEGLGFDPVSIIDMGDAHAQTVLYHPGLDGIGPAEKAAISFGAGFTLAVMVLTMERKNGSS